MATRKSSFFRLRLLSLIASHVQNSSTKQFMMVRVFLPTGAVTFIVGGPIEGLAFLGAGGPIDVARRRGGGPMDGI